MPDASENWWRPHGTRRTELSPTAPPGAYGLAGGFRDKRVITVGLCLIGLVLLIAMLVDRFFLGAALLAAPAVMLLIGGSPLRVLLVVLSTQIVLTISQLSAFQIGIGFIPVRVDDILTMWLVFLWLLSLPDGSMRGLKIGSQGYLILLFLVFVAYGTMLGLRTGKMPLYIGFQVKTYGAYFMYFPLLMVLSDEKSRKLVWKVLLVSAVVGGGIFMMKGASGAGEGVYYRDETGIRVSTRQPNAIAVIMLCFLSRLWKDWKNRPLVVVIIPSLILMGGSVILSQTRGLWGGILLALACAWILNLFRKRDGVPFGRKMLTSITVLAVIVIIVVMAVSALGILSAANVAARTGNESGSYLTDQSIVARLLAWVAIVQEISGSSMMLGKGLGAEYTCYRFEYGRSVALWYADGAFFQTALNMGVAGALTLLMIYMVSLVKAAKLFLRTASRTRAGVALGIFTGIILLLFASGFASVITNYRFTMLWALLFAFLQVEILRDSREATGETIPAA